MTKKELFVEYLRFNNMVPDDFDQDDLPNWDLLNLDDPMLWEYGAMAPDYPMMPYDDVSRRMRNRPRRPRPGYGPGYGPGPRYNPNPFVPLFWWWMLF